MKYLVACMACLSVLEFIPVTDFQGLLLSIAATINFVLIFIGE